MAHSKAEAVHDKNREFLNQYCRYAGIPFAFMAYFDLQSMEFVRSWVGHTPESAIGRVDEFTRFTRRLERRIAGYLKVHQIYSDSVAARVRGMQQEKSYWINIGDELIGIGAFIGKFVPIIAFRKDADDHTPAQQAIFKIGLAYVVQSLNEELLRHSDWRDDAFRTVAEALSIEFVVLNRRGEIVYDDLSDKMWSADLPGTNPSAEKRLAFRDGQEGTKLLESVAAATSQERKSSLIPLFDENGIPHLVLVTPLATQKSRLALVIFESEQTDHDWMRESFFDIYNLTPSERRVAKRIILGDTVAKIASRTGLSVETVRSYIKQILAKTGVHRQSELITAYFSSVLPMTKDLELKSNVRRNL